MKVTVARIYFNEGHHLRETILKRLHDDEGVKGVTLFRAIAGFGASGVMHSASLVDLSAELPLVVEFFDTPEKVTKAIEGLSDLIKPDHVLTFAADSH